MSDGLTISRLVFESHENSRNHGFWEGDGEQQNIPTKLMLIVSEVSEALEAFRKGDMEEFGEELADTFIRLGDLCGWLDIPIERAILDKMEKNRERPYKHGKRV
jgi:NTP pyrophosphatase (non-canonical NTP hydrolase)